MSAPQRIVIVGAGAAGVFTALELRRRFGHACELVLLERSGRVGGNAMAVGLGDTAIECGAQFFHRGAQRGFIELLDALELWQSCAIVRTAAGFTIWDRPRARCLLDLPATVAGFRGLGIGDWVRASKFGLFLAYCYALERWEHDWSLTVARWLGRMRLLDDAFKREVVIPFLYQFVALPPARIGEASAKYAVTYLVRTMFPGPGAVPTVPRIGSGRPTFEAYQSLVGIDEVHRRVLAAAEVVPRLHTEVLAIRRCTVTPGDAAIVEVVTPDGTLLADHVVLSCDPHASARMLAAGGTAASDLLEGLRALEYAALPISIQHGAPSHMPDRRAHWKPFNTVVDGEHLTFTVWFGPMREPGADGAPVEMFKSWGSSGAPIDHPGSEILAHQHFVPLPTAAFMRTREQLLARWQGDRGLWLAGGWSHWFDSQEGALRSAQAVADGIAGLARERAAQPHGPAALLDLLGRVATHAPAPLAGALIHALDEVEAHG